jgi:hypothetical protein
MEKNNKITICDYIANKVPNEAYEVLVNEGFTFDKPKSKKELAELLKQYVAMDRETALKRLAEIHPDKDLIQSIDRELNEEDYGGMKTLNQFGQEYANPFHRGKTIFQNASGGCGCKMGMDGSYHNMCSSCGMMSFNADGTNGGCGCGCGGRCGCGGNCGCGSKSKKYSNANGDESIKPKTDYAPLYFVLGVIVLFGIYSDYSGAKGRG